MYKHHIEHVIEILALIFLSVNTYSSKMLSVEEMDKIAAGFDGGTAKQPHIVTAAVRAIRMISFTGTSQV